MITLAASGLARGLTSARLFPASGQGDVAGAVFLPVAVQLDWRAAGTVLGHVIELIARSGRAQGVAGRRKVGGRKGIQIVGRRRCTRAPAAVAQWIEVPFL